MFNPQYRQQINVNGIELKPSDARKIQSIATALLFVFSAIASHFPQLLKRDTDMVTSYLIVPYLQRCYALLVTSNAVHHYWKVLHKGFNMDVLGVLPIHLHSPLGTVHPWDRAYISVKPLVTMLQPINIHWLLYTQIYIAW